MSRDTFYCHNWEGGATGSYWVDAKDAAKHSTMHSTGQTTKCYLVQNVSGTEAEEIWIRGKKRHYGRDRDLCQPFQFALCWESEDPGFTQGIMLKMMMAMRMTMMMTMVMPFVRTAVDNGVSHSFPPSPSVNSDPHYGRGDHSSESIATSSVPASGCSVHFFFSPFSIFWDATA